jgi:hypothetical protein
VKETLDNTQRSFFALDLDAGSDFDAGTRDVLTKEYGLDVAERDGTLQFAGGTYSAENDAVYDGLSRQGIRIVTFGPVLRNRTFPLPQILELLLDMGPWGMGTPVEIEFAGNLPGGGRTAMEFGMLQMRPLVVYREQDQLNVEDFDREKLICQSDQVLGNGLIEDIRDAVVVDFNIFDRARSREVAHEVSMFNTKLVDENRPYLLVGVGRWGSLDPWLGIPVTWDQIAGAKAIVETEFREMSVTPSQGSHFFQNITSFMVGYFTRGLRPAVSEVAEGVSQLQRTPGHLVPVAGGPFGNLTKRSRYVDNVPVHPLLGGGKPLDHREGKRLHSLRHVAPLDERRDILTAGETFTRMLVRKVLAAQKQGAIDFHLLFPVKSGIGLAMASLTVSRISSISTLPFRRYRIPRDWNSMMSL